MNIAFPKSKYEVYMNNILDSMIEHHPFKGVTAWYMGGLVHKPGLIKLLHVCCLKSDTSVSNDTSHIVYSEAPSLG